MRVLGILGMLLAAAIVLVLLVKVGQSLTAGDGGGGGGAKTGSQKAYDDLKKDGDMGDPKDVMKGALKGDL